ncbi:unnamed protein product [Prorocentrum cordatum]|uniref:Solute carrier family 40 protein n=1 Tax=Prorocentrum cordatum TaxID=2364126 RepID=A0ABN9VM53_9DINO|nr:unnamed protein product [Polarella glacialis]
MSLLLVVALHRTSLPPKGVYAACIFVGAGVSYAAAFFVKHNADFATACMALSVLPCVGSQGIPWGLIAASNKAAEERGLPVSTALQMALLNCGLVLGQQFTHLTLAAMESFVAPTLALPAMLAAGAVAMTVAGAGALMLPSGAEEHDALGAGGRTGGADLELRGGTAPPPHATARASDRQKGAQERKAHSAKARERSDVHNGAQVRKAHSAKARERESARAPERGGSRRPPRKTWGRGRPLPRASRPAVRSPGDEVPPALHFSIAPAGGVDLRAGALAAERPGGAAPSQRPPRWSPLLQPPTPAFGYVSVRPLPGHLLLPHLLGSVVSPSFSPSMCWCG